MPVDTMTQCLKVFDEIIDSCQVENLRHEALADRYFDLEADDELHLADQDHLARQVGGLLDKVSAKIDRSSKYR
jgi:hypothetical protein